MAEEKREMWGEGEDKVREKVEERMEVATEIGTKRRKDKKSKQDLMCVGRGEGMGRGKEGGEDTKWEGRREW